MSVVHYTCETCGERATDDNHACPGAPGDRLDALESRLDDLEGRLVWAATYAAEFDRQFADLYSAIDSGPGREADALAKVDVGRCKRVADAAVKGLET